MKDYWEEPTKKIINKKKITISIITIILIIILISITVIYYVNKEAREWIDKNILRKEIMQDKAITIELKGEQETNNIYVFDKNIGILNKNKFTIYNSTGNKEKELEIQISNPIFNSANRFIAIAEKKGQKVYLMTDKEITWENSVDGNITQVYVNKNGYVAVVLTNSSCKTVIVMYNPEGTQLFTTFLPNTRTADITISNDNKYLAIAEIDTSGTSIQSNIKIISIDKARDKTNTNQTNSIENTYKGEIGKLITNIKYQDKDKLICMYTDSIHVIEDGQDNVLMDNQSKKMIFQSIELTNHAIEIEEKSSGLFTADSLVNIVNTENKNSKQYTVNSVVKEIYTSGNIIALNLGTEIEFINTGGWLVKRYIANQEITNIVVSDSIAGIIYRDKLEIINL